MTSLLLFNYYFGDVNNKIIIEFSFRMISRIIKASVGIITPSCHYVDFFLYKSIIWCRSVSPNLCIGITYGGRGGLIFGGRAYIWNGVNVNNVMGL
jgi:hypothetical protein